MDGTTAGVIVIGIFGVIVVVLGFRFRRSLTAQIQGPGGTSLRVAGSNEQPPPERPRGALAEDLDVTGTNARLDVEDRFGHGATARMSQVEGPVRVVSEPPADPGAPPKGS